MLEEWFKQEMLVQTAVIIRARAAKLNCGYRVEEVKPGKGAVEEHAVKTVAQLSEPVAGDQKGVVYCRSRALCETMAERLGCNYYHSAMDGGEQQRRQVLEAWTRGGDRQSRWIVATTG